MFFLDHMKPQWRASTLFKLEHTPDRRLYAHLVAQGGLFESGELIRAYGFEWNVRMGLYPDSRGSYGPPISIIELDQLWRLMLVNGAS
jgi:hypothetical protein